MAEKSRRVVGQLGTVYELGEKLAEGGQGVVFKVKNGNRAVKLLREKSEQNRDRLRNQLTFVKTLPLEKLPLARPLEILQPPRLGYVMDLLTGMVPLSQLMDCYQDEHLGEWYLAGGGLRRRLYLLARCSEAFSQLHGMSLVYADPSPGNIFISVDVDALEVRLIDTDNLCYESSVSSIGTYTPGFGAPEIVRRESGANTLTDAHAFSVIAFKTLCLVHPLMGDRVNYGEPELEEQALTGQLPWIDDPDDTQNECSDGIPREIVLTKGLKELSQRCFCLGIREQQKRPGIAEWTEKLYAAADFTIQCPNCHGTYYASQKICSWCDCPRPTFVLIKMRRWEPDKGVLEEPKQLPVLTLDAANPLNITSRIFSFSSHSHTPELELTLEGQKVSIRSLSDRVFLLTSWQGSQEVEVRERMRSFPLESGKLGAWILHFGRLDRPHRVATFQLFPVVNS